MVGMPSKRMCSLEFALRSHRYPRPSPMWSPEGPCSSRQTASHATAVLCGPRPESDLRRRPAPASSMQVVRFLANLRSVGTFNPASLNEVRQNAAPPLGPNGYVPPSLLSIFAFPQTFFHNGQAISLDEVLNNVTHRSAGTSGVDTLTNT